MFTKCSQSPSEVLPQHASAMFLWKQVLYLATTPWRSVPELWLPLHKTLKTRILAKYKQRSCQTFHNFQHSLLLTVPPCPVQLWLSQTIKSRSSFHLFLPPGWQLRGFWKTQCFEGSPVWSRPLIINIDCQNHNIIPGHWRNLSPAPSAHMLHIWENFTRLISPNKNARSPPHSQTAPFHHFLGLLQLV